MKRNSAKLCTAGVLSLLVLTGCTGELEAIRPWSEQLTRALDKTFSILTKPNRPPSVAMTSPASGIGARAPATFSLAATASDPDGSVIKVEFFSNGAKIGEDTAAPYQVAYSGVGPGSYMLSARALDGEGASATASVAVRITSPDQMSNPMLLHVHPDNPRYFMNSHQQVVYLTGAHTWNSLVDMGTTDPPAPFDFDSYLTFLTARHHNLIRLWAWLEPRWSYGGEGMKYVTNFPYSRSGPGIAADGKPRFDLSRFDLAYFDRLRDRVLRARAKNIYVSVMLFEGWATQFGGQRGLHPFASGNNVNGIDGDFNDDGKAAEVYSLTVPAITRLQEAYVRKVIDTVGDLDNVLFEISNEAGVPSISWQNHFIDFVHRYEATRPLQHPVGFTLWGGASNTLALSSKADWVSITHSVSGVPPSWAPGKVSILDTDHIFGIGGDARWVWKAFLRGHNVLYMDPYELKVLTSEPANEGARLALGDARRYAQRVNLAVMAPRDGLVSSRFVLANTAANGGEYLALATSSSISVDLSASSNAFSVEWFDIEARTTTIGTSIRGGARVQLTTPGGRPNVVLYLRSIDDDARADLAVYRESTGQWFIHRSSDGSVATTTFGAPSLGDLPVAGDFDGDGRRDHAVYRSTTGQWFILRSSDGGILAVPFGAPSLQDVPIPRDFDGDGRTDLAVYRQSTGQWFIARSTLGVVGPLAFGAPHLGDVPVPADYDGDDAADVAVFRGTTGEWFIFGSTAGFVGPLQFGGALDVPVRADYDGDGRADLAVFREPTADWFIFGSTAGFIGVRWGDSSLGDRPVPADYDGDGRTDIAVFREATGQWHIRNSATGELTVATFGSPALGDRPTVFPQ